ncbi:MAG: hypothetical protein CUN56_02330 [Phototrophicales bacterium]|nr:MAG: hypothetical protein CUN56_02330 [Phototrophicales bacterium]RMG75294.1 MAG: hypothetical protein D6711_06985 [Chloroflexota bacterium]
MPVLLLAQGDAASKDLLRKAIEARYGTRPPALDSLKIDLNGRTQIKIGPISTWVPLDMTAYFKFPTAMRWEFVAKPLKLSIQRGVEAYDGETYRSMRGNHPPTVINEPEYVRSIRRRLWAVASVLLTPLSDFTVKVEATGNYSLRATNTKLDDYAEIFLRDDYTLDYVQVECLNPDTGQIENYIVRVEDKLITVDELLLPAKLSTFWNDKPSFEVEPVSVVMNPTIPDGVFKIEDN